jgi:hypothetical protein
MNEKMGKGVSVGAHDVTSLIIIIIEIIITVFYNLANIHAR